MKLANKNKKMLKQIAQANKKKNANLLPFKNAWIRTKFVSFFFCCFQKREKNFNWKRWGR